MNEFALVCFLKLLQKILNKEEIIIFYKSNFRNYQNGVKDKRGSLEKYDFTVVYEKKTIGGIA